jgi:putative flippase GtrA
MSRSLASLRLTMFDFRFGRFLVVGLANTFVGLSVIFAGKAFLAMGDVQANLLGYGVAVLLGFALNKKWTFQHTGAHAKAFARYVVVLILAYVANLATTLYAIDILHLNSYIAQALGIVPYAFTGYLGGRWFAFAPAQPTDR